MDIFGKKNLSFEKKTEKYMSTTTPLHLVPLNEIVKKWHEQSHEDEVSMECFLQVSAILRQHYDTHLNATKTAFRDPGEEGLLNATKDLDHIIHWIASCVAYNDKDKNALCRILQQEILKYQNAILKGGKRSLKDVFSSNNAPQLSPEEELNNLSLQDAPPDEILVDEMTETMDQEEEGDEDMSEEEKKKLQEFIVDISSESDDMSSEDEI